MRACVCSEWADITGDSLSNEQCVFPPQQMEVSSGRLAGVQRGGALGGVGERGRGLGIGVSCGWHL